MLNLDHLRYFLDSAASGSIAAAARRHHVSPSAISQAIRSLEKHFDCQLTTHARELILTAQGKALVESAPALFAAAVAIEDQVAKARAEYFGEVVFATQQSIAHGLLPEFLAQLRLRYPGLRPRIQIGTTSMVRRSLQMGDVEFVLSVDNVEFDEFQALTVRKGRFVLITADSSSMLDPIAGPFILTEDTRETKIFRREFERCHGHPPEVAMQINSWGVIRRLAESGLGIGLVPDYVVRPRHHLTQVACQLPPIPYRIAAFYPSRRKLSHMSKAFISALDDFLRRET